MKFDRAEAAVNRSGYGYNLDPLDNLRSLPCACCGAPLRPGDVYRCGYDHVRRSYCDHIRVPRGKRTKHAQIAGMVDASGRNAEDLSIP